MQLYVQDLDTQYDVITCQRATKASRSVILTTLWRLLCTITKQTTKKCYLFCFSYNNDWELILNFHLSRTVRYYNTNAQMASSDDLICLTFLLVFASFKLFYHIIYIAFIFVVLCCRFRLVLSRVARLRLVSDLNSCFSPAMTSLVIKYRTDARKHGIYLLKAQYHEKNYSSTFNLI